jgi:hypothetical protein
MSAWFWLAVAGGSFAVLAISVTIGLVIMVMRGKVDSRWFN